MTVQITNHAAGHDHDGPRRKVTCVTCKLKKCVGRCRWESVAQPPRGKVA